MDKLYSKNDISIVKSLKIDVEILSKNLCDANIIEAVNLGLEPKGALKKSFDKSTECYTVFYNQDPIAMYGVAAQELYPNSEYKAGLIWFVSSNKIKLIWRQMVKEMPSFIKKFLEEYNVLFNFENDQNKIFLKLLKLSGARVSEFKLPGENCNYHYFEFRRSDLCATQKY